MYKLSFRKNRNAEADICANQPVITVVRDESSDSDDILLQEDIAPALDDNGIPGEPMLSPSYDMDIPSEWIEDPSSETDEILNLKKEEPQTPEERYRNKLDSHRSFVKEAFYLLLEKLPHLFDPSRVNPKVVEVRINNHDLSKYKSTEFPYYAQHYFGTPTLESEQNYAKALIHHYHENPHHWQHWVYLHKGKVCTVDMDYVSILEMICDFMSFGLAANNPLEIVEYYNKEKGNICLSPKTRATVETIINQIESAFGKDI